jgi:hypothetical protein
LTEATTLHFVIPSGSLGTGVWGQEAVKKLPEMHLLRNCW